MKQQTVDVYVFDTLSDWESGYALAGINDPQFQAQPGRYRVRTVALKLAPIATIGGIRIVPDLTLDELSPSDSAMLILPGGVTWDQAATPKLWTPPRHSSRPASPSPPSAARPQDWPEVDCSTPADTPAMPSLKPPTIAEPLSTKTPPPSPMAT